MDRPGCHAHWQRVVTAYLATLADATPLPHCPNVSTRAMRTALRMMCRIAQNDGTMRYGLRASKLATLCEYSVATIHRAERYLVEHGYVERIQVGGGRAATRWRVVVEKLANFATTPPNAAASSTGPPAADERPSRWRWANSWRKQPAPGTSSPAVTSICSEHGGDGGSLGNGTPRCPQCRQSQTSPQPP
jgi:hypothetical protein